MRENIGEDESLKPDKEENFQFFVYKLTFSFLPYGFFILEEYCYSQVCSLL